MPLYIINLDLAYVNEINKLLRKKLYINLKIKNF
jgi:hypothetical protein